MSSSGFSRGDIVWVSQKKSEDSIGIILKRIPRIRPPYFEVLIAMDRIEVSMAELIMANDSAQ